MQFFSRLHRSTLAGIYISAACVAYLITTYHLPNDKGLGAMLFSFGIFAVTYCDLDLFTSRLALLVTRPPDELLKTPMYLFNIWFGNYLGCFISAVIIRKTRYADFLKDTCKMISDKHLADSPAGLFVAGVGCTLMLYMAIRMYNEHSQTVYGMVTLVAASVAFICAGFEHTIAVGFYMILGRYTFPERISVLLPIALGNTIGSLIPAAILERTKRDEYSNNTGEDH